MPMYGGSVHAHKHIHQIIKRSPEFSVLLSPLKTKDAKNVQHVIFSVCTTKEISCSLEVSTPLTVVSTDICTCSVWLFFADCSAPVLGIFSLAIGLAKPLTLTASFELLLGKGLTLATHSARGLHLTLPQAFPTQQCAGECRRTGSPGRRPDL